MKKVVLALLLNLAPLCAHSVLGRIQTGEISDIYPYLESGAVVIFDVDTTLVDTVHELGSEPWAEAMVQRYQHEKRLGIVEARGEMTPLWNAILVRSKVRPIHPQVQAAVRRLQKNRVCVMGISDKDPDIAYTRLEHLRLCDAQMGFSAPHGGHVVVPAQYPAKMVHGLLLTGVYNNPGTILVKLFDQVHLKPSRVIVVSSRISLLGEIERAVVSQGIPFLGIRYTRFDERMVEYRPDIAALQLKLFNHVLSDEAAAALKPGWGFWPF
ncbi:MAG: DUF2608 domain-containing protein [Verrucomicrobia bacterium]|nr:DUF2608 domain-containing protein [Verrucomicrobiota bacterium]